MLEQNNKAIFQLSRLFFLAPLEMLILSILRSRVEKATRICSNVPRATVFILFFASTLAVLPPFHLVISALVRLHKENFYMVEIESTMYTERPNG